jgi:hypothetical protein
MLSIDADAHVIETEKTWDYLEGSDRRYRPVPITVDMPSGKTQNFWIIGGRLIGGRDNIGQERRKSLMNGNIDPPQTHGRNRHERSSPLSHPLLAPGHG